MRKQLLITENPGLEHKYWLSLKRLNTPVKVQNFLNKIPFNFEKHGETHNSVAVSLKGKKAHCFEGALIAATALWIQGRKPLLLDLFTLKPDVDHVVVLFKEGKYWGAISKTNHNVLRYRDPIYRDVRELAMSYFNEYFLADGTKTLRKYSDPFDLSQFGTEWVTTSDNLVWLARKLDKSLHHNILSSSQARKLRKADRIEVDASGLVEWERR